MKSLSCSQHLLYLCIHWPLFTIKIYVMKWKHFPRYWPFVRGIHRSPVNSPHKGQWRGALMFSFTFAWINGRVINREAGELRRHRTHFYVIVMQSAANHDFLGCRRFTVLKWVVVTCKKGICTSILAQTLTPTVTCPFNLVYVCQQRLPSALTYIMI